MDPLSAAIVSSAAALSQLQFSQQVSYGGLAGINAFFTHK